MKKRRRSYHLLRPLEIGLLADRPRTALRPCLCEGPGGVAAWERWSARGRLIGTCRAARCDGQVMWVSALAETAVSRTRSRIPKWHARGKLSSDRTRRTSGSTSASRSTGRTVPACIKARLLQRGFLMQGSLNSSSWEPVRSKNATLSLLDQMTSQSPALATWHSLRPAHLPESVGMLCRRLRMSRDSGVLASTSSTTSPSCARSHPRRLALRLRSRENAAEKSAVSLAIMPAPHR